MTSALSFWAMWTWIATCLIGLATMYLVRHFQTVWKLPPGPFPLPLLGNLLMLRGEGNDLSKVIMRLRRKYKDIFTLWLGYRPTVVVCNWDLCQEALVSRRNDCAGRVLRHSLEILLEGNSDVAFADFGEPWEVLRKVMAVAVRKYAVSENLAELVNDVVDRVGEAMEKEGKPVDAHAYVYLIVYNILASSAFGQRFEMDDPEFIRLRQLNDEANEKFGVGLPSDALPLLKVFYKKRIADIMELSWEQREYVRKKFKEHQESYQSGDVRDFTDAVLAAREEAEEEGKDGLQHLTEGNMIALLLDLFAAGTDTTRAFLQWTLLLITDKPSIQKKMQAEIDKNIGSRFPLQKDKLNCPYVNAVLTEVLRLKPSVDFSLEHRTICDTQIGKFTIPADTSCLFYIKGPQTDEEHWKDGHKFNPDRFLDSNGKFKSARVNGYMPFGLGSRSCPGEKLALADTFLIVVRLLQKYELELEGGPGSVDMNFESIGFTKETAPYKLKIVKRDR